MLHTHLHHIHIQILILRPAGKEKDKALRESNNRTSLDSLQKLLAAVGSGNGGKSAANTNELKLAARNCMLTRLLLDTVCFYKKPVYLCMCAVVTNNVFKHVKI